MSIGRSPAHYIGNGLAIALSRTAAVLKDISIELPAAYSMREASGVVLGKDRKLYVGYALVALAVLIAIALS